MTPAERAPSGIAEAARDLQSRDEPFAFATIVRTAGATAAKPGAKALIRADGTIAEGFLGGGCTCGAVKRAALEAIASGAPRLISVAPEDLLADMGVAPGETSGGVTYARNGCPSRGTVDIFVEPCLPMPELAILGTSPVARALARLAPGFHWAVRTTPSAEAPARLRAIVVATQGHGDLDALKAALAARADHVAFVGSARKYAALAERLANAAVAGEDIAAVSAPAGLNIGAVTPEEIALSILAELVQVRRRARRGP